MTEELGFVPGDSTWQAMRDKGLRSLYFFAHTICRYGSRVPMTEPAHKLLCKIVERRTGVKTLDSAHIRKFEMPRGTGKTTTITQAYLLQLICRHPEIAILLVNEVEKLAIKILGEIKQQIETNDLLRILYPEIIPDDLKNVTWSATSIVTKRSEPRKEPTIMVSGVGGALAGNHPDVIFVDDMLSDQAMESARAGSVADLIGQTNRWIHRLLPLLSGSPYRELTFIGTRWWYGDSYEHLEDAFGYGQQEQHVMLKTKITHKEITTTQHLPAYRKGDILVFRRAAIEDGQPAFISLGEKFSLEELAKFQMTDPELFAANMMNEPANEATATFKQSWLRYYDYEDGESGDQISYIDAVGKRKTIDVDSLDILVFVDPGGFSKGIGGDRAWAATIVVGSTPDGLHFILDNYSERGSYTKCIKEVVGFVRRYGARKVYVELAGQQLVFLDNTRTAIQAAGLAVPVDDVTLGKKSKDDRILGLEDYFERARIYFGRGGKFTELVRQYQQFPKSARKDLMDVLSQGPGRWKRTQNGSARQATQRQQAELQAYFTRRGITPAA